MRDAAIAGLVALAGAAAVASSSASRSISRTASRVASRVALATAASVDVPIAIRRRVLALVTASEGTYTSTNRNTDGAGLSWGILQWAQAPGSLGILLRAMYERDPARFAATFGPAWQQLLQVTEARSLAPVAGDVLWSDPWVLRFRAAGTDPVWQAVQLDVASRGPWWQGAAKAAAALGEPPTERGLAVLLDTSVQQGPGFALSHAKRAAAAAPVGRRVAWYALHAADRYRRTTAPTEPHPSAPRLTWQPAPDGSWHVYAGRVDLYESIRRRRLALLQNPTLSDAPITSTPQPSLSGSPAPFDGGAAALLTWSTRDDVAGFGLQRIGARIKAPASNDASGSSCGSIGCDVANDDGEG